MSVPAVDMRALREMLERATVEPWTSVSAEVRAYGRGLIARCPSPTGDRGVIEQHDNAALIAALKNAAPALLARLEQAEADYLAVAEAAGIYYDADGHARKAGPVDAVVAQIEMLRAERDAAESRAAEAVGVVRECVRGLASGLSGRGDWLDQMHESHARAARFLEGRSDGE